MKLKINDQIPNTEIFQLVDGEPQKSKLREIIGNGKIVLFEKIPLNPFPQYSNGEFSTETEKDISLFSIAISFSSKKLIK